MYFATWICLLFESLHGYKCIEVNMVQFESDASSEQLIPSVEVLTGELIDDTDAEAANIGQRVLALSANIEDLQNIDFLKIYGFDDEQRTRIIVGLASARRSLGKVAELLVSEDKIEVDPTPEAEVVPLDRSRKTSREDYGESIFPTGARFLVDVPEIGMKMIEFGDKSINIDESKLRLGPHQLYLLTLFLKNPQQAFTREDIANGGYHPRQPYISNRLNNLSVHLSSLRRTLARAFTGNWYTDGPILTAYIDLHIAFTWVYPVAQQQAVEIEDSGATAKLESDPVDEVLADTSANITLISEPSSEIYGGVDETIEPETEVVVASAEDCIEPDSEVASLVERGSATSVLWLEGDSLFVNGEPAELTLLESDVMRFMVVARQTRSIKFEQLFQWLKPAHPKLSVDGLNVVIDSLNRPLRFHGVGNMVKTEIIETARGSSKQLTLGEDFTHRRLEEREVHTLLAKYLPN